MFKKTLIAAIAFSFVGASFAQAQDWRPQHGQHKVEPRRPMPPHKFERNDRRDYGKHNRWSKGQRYNDWRRHQESAITSVMACVRRRVASAGSR